MSPRLPSIGVTPDWTHPPERAFPRYDLAQPYADAVLAAGGVPLVLPYSDRAQMVEEYLGRIDGLLVTGGAFDVPPSEYGEEVRAGCGALKPERTRFERAMIVGALERGLPILGVCGGMQLLNVHFGGTLWQDLKTELTSAGVHEQKNDKRQPSHSVQVLPDTSLAKALGAGPKPVNSTHHQAVRTLGHNLVASAAAEDGVVEALEAPAHRFVLGVQWHPETLVEALPVQLEIYRAFMQAARERA
jgi:putative glutamine amidotransferase